MTAIATPPVSVLAAAQAVPTPRADLVTGVAPATARRLRRLVAVGPRCPDCGGPLAFGEGCRLCPVCGHSSCA